MASIKHWSTGSWKSKRNPYNIEYANESHASTVLTRISTLPPLIIREEIRELRQLLAKAARGQVFVIQGGDCAELFEYCTESAISGRLILLHRLKTIITEVTGMSVVMLGRIAGQYGKPRNSMSEVVAGKEIPKFHGDLINSYETCDRQPNPERLLSAYMFSCISTNHLRSMLRAAPPDILAALSASIGNTTAQDSLSEGPNVISQINQTLGSVNHTARHLGPFFTSHEGLFLHYEEAVTRHTPQHSTAGETQCSQQQPTHFNGSAHFIWIGDKTRSLQGAHVEYCRGLENPIGVKLGPSTESAELPLLLDLLDPMKQPGKITLITRLGAHHVQSSLLPIIRAVQSSRHEVVWQCDPLHGNTRTTEQGIRTRSFNDVLSELFATIETHSAAGSKLGGIHLEMTSDDVVECTGGPQNWDDSQLGALYMTRCDPRLNAIQAQALTYLAAVRLKQADLERVFAGKPKM